MRMKHTAIALSALFLAVPALAQDSSYTQGSVWVFSEMKVEPGQFENYIDYLGGNWRKTLELQKKDGYLVSYHVLAVNNSRANDPDLILAIEYKDYLSTAQQVALQAKVAAAMASDAHKMEAASGDRVKMRTQLSSMELQELKFK